MLQHQRRGHKHKPQTDAHADDSNDTDDVSISDSEDLDLRKELGRALQEADRWCYVALQLRQEARQHLLQQIKDEMARAPARVEWKNIATELEAAIVEREQWQQQSATVAAQLHQLQREVCCSTVLLFYCSTVLLF